MIQKYREMKLLADSHARVKYSRTEKQTQVLESWCYIDVLDVFLADVTGKMCSLPELLRFYIKSVLETVVGGWGGGSLVSQVGEEEWYKQKKQC